ncbi:MAG: hypothetical protein C4570_03695 [Ammonifex sp.]|jgi:hypothetical protein|nr:MAG: hypothetical protein C4570_03695 [Ammonifex sp.]
MPDGSQESHPKPLEGRSLRDRLKKALAAAMQGEIVVLTHPWNRKVPGGTAETVVKVMCGDRRKLVAFGQKYSLPGHWIHDAKVPHFDLWGKKAEAVISQVVGEGLLIVNIGRQNEFLGGSG